MKQIRKWILILLVTLLLTACAAGDPASAAAAPTAPAATESAAAPTAVPEQAAQLPNPIHDVADYPALLAAVPDVLMSDAPKGAENIAYSWIEGTPVIAQIDFMLDGNSYTYRGAKADSADSVTDISGMYDALDKSAEMIASDKDGLIGGVYTLDYSSGSTQGRVAWYYIPTGCQYSVTTPDGCDISQGILSVVEQVMPISEIQKEDLAVSGSIEGATVVTAQDGDLTVNTTDGKTLAFNMGLLPELTFAAGDVVDISYNQMDTNLIALSVTKNATAAAAPANTISGTVYSCAQDSMYVSTESGMVYGFVLDKDTVYSGESTTLREGSEVVVTYDGDLSVNVRAKNIETTKVGSGKAASAASSGSDKTDSDTGKNKRLTGYVTDYSSNSITIETSNGRYWTFRIGNLTSFYGKHSLQVGSRVRINYDGYASDMPLAKHIQVYSSGNPDPQPQPTPKKHTMEGFLLSIGGSTITIDTATGNQHSFTITSATEIVGYCEYYGNVRVTYYGADEAGGKIATRIVMG